MVAEYDYNQLVKYLRNINSSNCEVSIRNFIKIIDGLAKDKQYSDFKELIDVWISANQRNRPDLEPNETKRRSIKNIATLVVAADHGENIEFVKNPFNQFHKGNLGPAMRYFKNYLKEGGISISNFEINMN